MTIQIIRYGENVHTLSHYSSAEDAMYMKLHAESALWLDPCLHDSSQEKMNDLTTIS
jgi:hypothetical protein